MANSESLFLQLSTAGLSCACSQTTVHWTETTMVRQQLAKGSAGGNLYSMTARIAREEGARALYRGYSAAMLREMTYSSIRFGLYDPVKVLLGATDPATTPFWKKVLAGLSAGAFAASLMSPTDLLKIRMQKQTGEFQSMACVCIFESAPLPLLRPFPACRADTEERARVCVATLMQVSRAPDHRGAAGRPPQLVPRRVHHDHAGGGSRGDEDGYI